MARKAILSDEKLAGLVQSVGFSSSRTHRGAREDAVAVAIILAESGGNVYAHNDNPATGDDSFGLFQINMIGRLGDERARQYNLDSYANLYEPKRNAEIAFDIFKRAGYRFTDWSTYKRGTYVGYLSRANKAVGSPDSKLPTLEGQLEGALPGVPDALAQLFSGQTWLRVAGFVGGVFLIIIGVVLYAGQSGVAGKVVSAVPVAGKAARVVRRVA